MFATLLLGIWAILFTIGLTINKEYGGVIIFFSLIFYLSGIIAFFNFFLDKGEDKTKYEPPVVDIPDVSFAELNVTDDCIKVESITNDQETPSKKTLYTVVI